MSSYNIIIQSNSIQFPIHSSNTVPRDDITTMGLLVALLGLLSWVDLYPFSRNNNPMYSKEEEKSIVATHILDNHLGRLEAQGELLGNVGGDTSWYKSYQEERRSRIKPSSQPQ